MFMICYLNEKFSYTFKLFPGRVGVLYTWYDYSNVEPVKDKMVVLVSMYAGYALY